MVLAYLHHKFTLTDHKDINKIYEETKLYT